MQACMYVPATSAIIVLRAGASPRVCARPAMSAGCTSLNVLLKR